MQSVYKYKIQPFNETHYFPDGARILSVGEQDGDMFVWALVNSNIPAETPRRIKAYGTGHPIEDGNRVFIGTVQMQNGLVFHFFEEL